MPCVICNVQRKGGKTIKNLQVYFSILFIFLLQCFIAPGVDAAEPAPNEVILYEAKDYIGDSESFKLPGHLPYWGTPVGNKLYGKVSSIRLGSDVGVYLYERGDWVDRVYIPDYNRPCRHGHPISKSTELLECNDFFNALIIYRKGISGLVGADLRAKSWLKGVEGMPVDYSRALFLFPPLISSHCFDLQDDIFIKDLLIISTKNPEHKVTVKVYKNNSCTGKAVTFPGPYSEKKFFNLEEYGFSGKGAHNIFMGNKTTKDSPQSMLVTYEGPYNQYHGEAHVKAPPSKEPQWVEEDTDRPGKNYRNFWVMRTDPDICSDACKNDDKCKAYTYVPKGLSGDPSKGRCWLKYDVPEPITREGMVSGVKLSFEHATMAPGGSTTGPGVLLPPKVESGKAGIAMVDDIMSFHLVETKGNHLIFEVDYSAVGSHGNIIHLGGWIYDGKGQAISGYKPLSFLAPGIRKGRVEITIDPADQGQFGKEIEFFLFEPNKAPFIKKRFPLNMRLPGEPPKAEMVTGYVAAPGAKAQGGQQIDLSGTWNSNIGLAYQISQNGNKFSYLDPMMHKQVNGTITGKIVAVSWMEGNNLKELKGTITSMESDNRAKTISWANGVIFNKVEKSPTMTASPSQPSQIDMATGGVLADSFIQYSDLSGTWNSNIGLVYEISQNGNEISYKDPMMHKQVNGTVDGKTVTVYWMEGNAGKSIEGTITSVGNDGVAKRIEWENSVVFHR